MCDQWRPLAAAPFLFFAMPSVAERPKTKRRPGRPAARWLSLDEVAEITRCDAGVLCRLLDAVPGTIPGADKDEGGWKVPERGLRAILGAPAGPLPQYATVEEVALALRRSPKTVYWWLGLRHADGRTPLLEHRRVLGTILIPALAVLALPDEMPEQGRRPLFLCGASNAGGEHD
jgi:hypothetical protein